MTTLRVVVSALDKFIDDIIKKIVLDIVANVRSAPDTGYGTPVDTGWARANWVPRIGSPALQVTGTREAVSGSAQETGIANIAISYRASQGPVFITNNVPYIVLLNEGSSGQAPRGFVQNAIAKAIKQDLFRSAP